MKLTKHSTKYFPIKAGDTSEEGKDAGDSDRAMCRPGQGSSTTKVKSPECEKSKLES